MVAYNPELRADQIEVYLGTHGAVPLPNLRSFFYQLERVTSREEYFAGTVQLALSAAKPGSLGLILDIQRRLRTRSIVLGRTARRILDNQKAADDDLQARMAIAAERSAAAAERAADAAERSASAGERTASLTQLLLYSTVAAVLVPIIVEEIRSGDLAAPIVKIDQNFGLIEVRVNSASNGQWIPSDELPDERVLEALKAVNREDKLELLALNERRDIDRLFRSQGRANLIGQLRLVRGRVHMRTQHGNEFEIDAAPSHVPLGVDVFVVIEPAHDDTFRPTLIEKVDPL